MEKPPLHDTTPQPEAEVPGVIPAPSGAANLIDTDYVVGQDNIKGRFLRWVPEGIFSCPKLTW